MKDGNIPTHDYPRPCRSVCCGSGEPPRRRKSALWKDDALQRGRDFLDQARTELKVYGFAVVKQLATLNGLMGGTMECPLCQGQLRFSIAESNGHCAAKCEHADCINAME